MAAILCHGIGSCCKGIGQCLSLPCSLCGDACGETCRFLGKALSSPFTPYLLTTLALNLPPMIWGLKAVLQNINANGGANFQRCHGDLWIWVNGVLSLVHILAAFYIVNRIQQEKKNDSTLIQATVDGQKEENTVETGKATSYQNMKEEPTTQKKSLADSLLTGVATAIFAPSNKTKSQTTEYGGVHETVYDDGESNSMQRLKQVLCYDVVVAFYIVLALIWCIWQSMGITQIIFPDDADGGSDLCLDIENWVSMSIMCGFLYIMLVFVAFCCSLICLRH